MLFIQYLAINNNELKPNSIIIDPSRAKILQSTKLTLQFFNFFAKVSKFSQIWSHWQRLYFESWLVVVAKNDQTKPRWSKSWSILNCGRSCYNIFLGGWNLDLPKIKKEMFVLMTDTQQFLIAKFLSKIYSKTFVIYPCSWCESNLWTLP